MIELSFTLLSCSAKANQPRAKKEHGGGFGNGCDRGEIAAGSRISTFQVMPTLANIFLMASARVTEADSTSIYSFMVNPFL